MATKPVSAPVEDSIARVNDEIAVGEDLDFQRKWWRFENAVWVIFTLIIVLDLCGVFGRGPIAKAERHSADGSIDVKYERIERTDSFFHSYRPVRSIGDSKRKGSSLSLAIAWLSS